jgi:hypothetical protein
MRTGMRGGMHSSDDPMHGSAARIQHPGRGTTLTPQLPPGGGRVESSVRTPVSSMIVPGPGPDSWIKRAEIGLGPGIHLVGRDRPRGRSQWFKVKCWAHFGV